MVPSDHPLTVLDAARGRRFLLSSWPWRALAHAVTTVPVLAIASVVFWLLTTPLLVLVIRTLEGAEPLPLYQVLVVAALGILLVLGVGPWCALPLARLELRRLSLVDSRPVGDPEKEPSGRGLGPWVRARGTDPMTWRALAHLGLLATVLPVVYLLLALAFVLVLVLLAGPLLLLDSGTGTIAMGPTQISTTGEAVPYAVLAVLLLPGLPYLVALVAGGHGAVVRVLLTAGDGEELQHQLVEVSRSRTRLVDAFEDERRRIERDLHDGAQSQLLNLTLKLGVAQLDLPPDSPAAKHVGEAHEQAKGLMTELRQIVRGIHPRVLTDRGLAAALWELTDESAVPVTLQVDVPDRLPEHIESTAYFTVIEGLNNITKHSAASAAEISAEVVDGRLVVDVRDDGRGGAVPSKGGGLTGSADRVAAVGGTMRLSSPEGGPTHIRAELPCPT